VQNVANVSFARLLTRELSRPSINFSHLYGNILFKKGSFFLRGRATLFDSPVHFISQRYSGTSQISVSFLPLRPSLFCRLVFGQSRKKILNKKWLGVLSSTPKCLVPGASLSSSSVLHERAKLWHPYPAGNTFRRSSALFHR